jgi:hypothetical protein
MRGRLNRMRRASEGDGGYALLVVLGVGVMLLALVATALTVASSGYRKAGTDEDWNAALSAAYAGLEEYRSRLANDSTYVKYGNPASDFTAATTSTVNMPAVSNPAFGIGATGPWAQIPGSDGEASYRYEVDNSAFSIAGTVRLQVTGRVGTQTRTIVADLRQSGFIDYLYFTEFEVSDPLLSGDDEACEQYAWAGRPAGCTTIQFGAMDVINGPLHSNDRLVICGGTFNGAVTTANPLTPIYSKPSGCGSATFAVGTGPTVAQTVLMPPTNEDLRLETRNDLADVPRPGCLYTGPTSITFHPNGTMTVISPWTKYTNVSQTSGVGSGNPPACGQPGTATGQLGSAAGATVPVLNENLLYVQEVPRIAGDPNRWPTTGSLSRPTNFTCTAADTTADVPAGWNFGSLQYPVSGEGTPMNASEPYGCDNGDLFVRGSVNGATTIAAENFVYITGDLTYADPQDDVLGVVGQNAVMVWNPIKPDDSLLSTTKNRTIHAAIVSVAHTFTVQNYRRGPNRGTLTVLGAIAQRFRGPVATTSGSTLASGYAKNYSYDTRLKNAAPPKFITPVSTTFGVAQVAGVPSAFTADGAKR